MAENSTADVSNVKGVQGGYGFSAPIGTTAPGDSDPFADLAAAFENMGFIGKDGIEEQLEQEIQEEPDMNGDIIWVGKSSEKESLVLTLVSHTRAALEEMFGHDNVADGTGCTKLTHRMTDHDPRVYVFDLVLKDGQRLRKVVPNGVVAKVGSITYVSTSLYARQITISCLPDEAGSRCYDYLQADGGGTTTTTTTGE
jgi:hypothetical protein